METTSTTHPARPRHIRTRMASGLLALIPIAVTIVVLRFVFNITAGALVPVLEPIVGHWPVAARMGLSLVIFLVSVYLLGALAMNVVGRKILRVVEDIVLKVPFVKVVYSASKQVVGAFQGRGARAFKSVVFVDFPYRGMKAVGFVTSNFRKQDGTDWCTVFVPTTPNPTTGFLQIVPAAELERTTMNVEDGIKMVMSLGVLMPE